MAFGIRLCFFVVVLLLMEEGHSLQCYQCTSPVGGHCDNPINRSKVNMQECFGQQQFCALLNVSSNGDTEIRRECADAQYCSVTRTKRQAATSFARSCTTCSWNLCNSSPKQQQAAPSFGIGIAGLIFIKYYTYIHF